MNIDAGASRKRSARFRQGCPDFMNLTFLLQMKLISKSLILSAALAAFPALTAAADSPLSGTALLSPGDSGDSAAAFDGNTSTIFSTGSGQFKYVGLDLGDTYVVTSIGFVPESGKESDMTLGMFEGANSADFKDAVPIQMIKSKPASGWNHLTVQCSRAFRYLRYVGPKDGNCRVAEIEFRGNRGTGDDSFLWQITNLPTMVISVQDESGKAIVPPDKSQDDATGVYYTVIANHKIDTYDTAGAIRIRGNASAGWEKKPWKVKFGSKQNPLSLNPEGKKNKKWALLSNHSDKSLMRNMVAFDVARKISKVWVPGIAAVDVVLNGEYQGCYQLAEAENVQKGRVDIEEFNIDAFEGTDKAGVHYNSVEEAFAAGGFMIEADGYAHQEDEGCYFDTDTYGVGYSFESPDPADFTDSGKRAEMVGYVKNAIHEIENLAKQSGSYEALRGKMHVDDLLRYLIINDLCANPDALWSVKMYREGTAVTNKQGELKDSLLHIGPVWDFDLGFGNDEYSRNPESHNGFIWDWDATSAADKDAGWYDGNHNWQWGSDKTAMRYFVHDIFYGNESTMKELMRNIYAEAAAGGLSGDYVEELIDNIAAEIDESQKLNFMRWPVLNTKIHREPQTFGTYKEYVSSLKSFVSAEFPHFEQLIGYSAAEPDYLEPVNVAFTGNDKTGWDHRYTVSAETFKKLKISKGGKLYMKMSSNGGQWDDHYDKKDSGYDHNKNGSDHIFTDPGRGGYWYENLNGTREATKNLTSDQVANLLTYGHCFEANNCILEALVYAGLANQEDEGGDDNTEDKQTGDRWTIYNLWNCNMDEAEVYIPASFFKNFTEKYGILVTRTIEQAPSAAPRREAGVTTPTVDLYTRDTDYNRTDLATAKEFKALEGTAYFHENLTADEIALLKERGLFVGGSGYKLDNVSALVPEGLNTGVDGIAADCGNGETEWFTLQGIRVTAPAEPGVYIRRQNGRALKIRVR